MRILINASNLQGGGSIQVASSIIYELMNDTEFLEKHNITLFINEKLISNISCSIKCNYEVLNWTPLSLFNPLYFFKFKNFDVVFNVFGPVYSFIKNSNTFTGFALPYLFEKHISIKSKLRKYFFFEFEKLIIEHDWLFESTKDIFTKNKIFIANNALNNVFFLKENHKIKNKKFKYLKVEGYKFFYCISRNYAHKNIDKLIELIKRLNLKGKFALILSLKAQEISSLNINQKFIVNLGELNIKNIPSVINSCDYFISLSDKECFSVSPLEALKMGKKVYLNDRVFYKQTIGSFATYIDSNDLPKAEKIILDTFDKLSDNTDTFLEQFHPKVRWKKIKKLLESHE